MADDEHLEPVTEDPTDPGGAVPEESTPSSGFREEPTVPSIPIFDEPARSGFRDELTVPAGTRTIALEVQPWMAVPDPPPRTPRADPWFWPVVVFVAVFLSVLGVSMLHPAAPRSGSAELITSP